MEFQNPDSTYFLFGIVSKQIELDRYNVTITQQYNNTIDDETNSTTTSIVEYIEGQGPSQRYLGSIYWAQSVTNCYTLL